MKNYMWSISFLVLGAGCGMTKASESQYSRGILPRLRPKTPTEKLQAQQQVTSERYKQRLDAEAQQRRLEEKRSVAREDQKQAQKRVLKERQDTREKQIRDYDQYLSKEPSQLELMRDAEIQSYEDFKPSTVHAPTKRGWFDWYYDRKDVRSTRRINQLKKDTGAMYRNWDYRDAYKGEYSLPELLKNEEQPTQSYYLPSRETLGRYGQNVMYPARSAASAAAPYVPSWEKIKSSPGRAWNWTRDKASSAASYAGSYLPDIEAQSREAYGRMTPERFKSYARERQWSPEAYDRNMKLRTEWLMENPNPTPPQEPRWWQRLQF